MKSENSPSLTVRGSLIPTCAPWESLGAGGVVSDVVVWTG